MEFILVEIHHINIFSYLNVRQTKSLTQTSFDFQEMSGIIGFNVSKFYLACLLKTSNEEYKKEYLPIASSRIQII